MAAAAGGFSSLPSSASGPTQQPLRSLSHPACITSLDTLGPRAKGSRALAPKRSQSRTSLSWRRAARPGGRIRGVSWPGRFSIAHKMARVPNLRSDRQRGTGKARWWRFQLLLEPRPGKAERVRAARARGERGAAPNRAPGNSLAPPPCLLAASQPAACSPPPSERRRRRAGFSGTALRITSDRTHAHPESSRFVPVQLPKEKVPLRHRNPKEK